MVEHLLTALSIVRVISAAVAIVLVFFAARAWRRTGDQRMFRLFAGFTILMVSLLIEGASFQILFPGNLVVAHLLEGGTQLVAMLILVWSVL